MEKLLKAGYGYSMHTSVASIMGDNQMHFWGCACPLWWVGPSYDMEAIQRRGAFGTQEEVVISIGDSIEELEGRLLVLASKQWPDPHKLPNGEDVRRIWPSLYPEVRRDFPGG